MHTLFYLLKANFAIIALYLFYRAFFKNDTFFTGKRFLLLAICLMSFTIPFMNFPTQFGNAADTFGKLKENVFNLRLPEYTVSPAKDTSSGINFMEIPTLVYLSVAVIFLLKIVPEFPLTRYLP